MRDLCRQAVEAAVAAGASYADARAVVRRSQRIATKNGAVETVSRLRERGRRRPRPRRRRLGLRVRPAPDATGARATPRFAPAPSRAPLPPAAARHLASARAAAGDYRDAVEIDPFAVSLADKVALCLRAEEGMRRPETSTSRCAASARAIREQKVLLSSEGTEVEQELVECGGGIDAIAAGDGLIQIAQLSERARPVQRPGRLGVRRGPRARPRGAARRRAGGCAPAGARVPRRA